MNLTLESVMMTDDPASVPESIVPEYPAPGYALHLDWNPATYPYWFPEGDSISLNYCSAGNGEAAVKITLYDYHHREVGSKTMTVKLGEKGKITLPSAAEYGPYIAMFRITFPDNRELSYQKVFAVVGSSPTTLNDLLGGHGNAELIRTIGGSRERLWDQNNTLCWRNVEEKESHFNWKGCRLSPLKNMIVLDRPPQWAPPWERDSGAFSRYVDAISRQFQGEVEIYELFNEPYLKSDAPDTASTGDNVIRFKNMQRQGEMMKHLTAIIRKNDPVAVIAAGGPSPEIPPGLDLWEKMLQNKIFDPVDVITGHFYVGGGGTLPLDQD
ncbi:MAG: hypothetical protein EOM65_14070, partial [Synergistales bacterium]|nr:hypothetical protein [Synergistales bacterium]